MKNVRPNPAILICLTVMLLSASCISTLPAAQQGAVAGEGGAANDTDTLLPYQDDVLLWLGAAEGLVVDEAGNVAGWVDRLSGEQFSLDGTLVEKAMNGKPVIRLAGGRGIDLEAGLDNGPSATFIVFKRDSEQATGPNWQRLLSIWNGDDAKDLRWPSHPQMIRNGREVLEPTVIQASLPDDARAKFAIGMNAVTGEDNFHGDIAEIIIYKRAFEPTQPADEIIHYLTDKWGAAYEVEPVFTWRGPLTEPAARTNHNYPLSDQENSEGWTLYEPWSDEFDDGVLDTDQWLPHNHEWYGRPPARFLPENVSEGDGSVKLAMRLDPSLPEDVLYEDGQVYKDYSSATLSSLTAKRYGYVEARAKAGVGFSAFWLYAESMKDGKLDKLEIDVYEIGGLEKGYEELYNMNTWKWVKDGLEGRFENGSKWESGIRFAEDFHVFGFKWTPAFLEYYVDGVLVRRMPNAIFHSPLLLLFDTETMPGWFGVPPDDHLPAFHEIDYVRTWTNPGTEDTWQDEYTLLHDPRTDNLTAAYVSQFPGHIDEGATGPVIDRIFCHSMPESIDSRSDQTVTVDYIAADTCKELVVELYAADTRVGRGVVTVDAGVGSADVPITLASEPAAGTDYRFRASIGTIGAGDGQATDFCMADVVVSKSN